MEKDEAHGSADSPTVTKVVVRAPQGRLYLGKSSGKLVGTD